MRIISGKYKGRTIEVNRKFDSRPTTDYARESLFNILAHTIDFETTAVLDLFGGTGSISFEFASRGCPAIDIVELDPHALKSIANMAEKLKISGLRLIRSDAYRYIKTCGKRYDLVFADPPFAQKELADLPELVFNSSILKAGGRFILEHSKEYDFEGAPHFLEHRKYGHVHFSFFG